MFLLGQEFFLNLNLFKLIFQLLTGTQPNQMDCSTSKKGPQTSTETCACCKRHSTTEMALKLNWIDRAIQGRKYGAMSQRIYYNDIFLCDCCEKYLNSKNDAFNFSQTWPAALHTLLFKPGHREVAAQLKRYIPQALRDMWLPLAITERLPCFVVDKTNQLENFSDWIYKSPGKVNVEPRHRNNQKNLNTSTLQAASEKRSTHTHSPT